MRVLVKIVFAIQLLLIATVAHADIPKRVVVAGGGITEIIYQLGAESVLAGVDTTSEYPVAAKKLPSIGYMRAISAEGVLSLRPEVLLLTEEAGPAKVLDVLKQAGVNLRVLNSEHSIPALLARVKTVAELLGKQDQGRALINSLQQQQAQLQVKINGRDKPRVLFLLTHGGRSPMSAGKGTAADSVMKLAGAENVVQNFHGYRPLSQEAIAALQPDFIVTTRQGLQQIGGAGALLKRAGINLTPAAHKQQLITMDASYLLGFGPRVLDAANQLADKLNIDSLAQQ